MWWRQHWISPWPLVAKVIVTATVSRHTTTWSMKLRRAVLKVIFGKTVPRTPSHRGLVYRVVHRTVHRIVYFLKCDVKNLNKIWIWIVNKQTNKHIKSRRLLRNDFRSIGRPKYMFSEYMLPEYRLYILISNTITKKTPKTSKIMMKRIQIVNLLTVNNCVLFLLKYATS